MIKKQLLIIPSVLFFIILSTFFYLLIIDRDPLSLPSNLLNKNIPNFVTDLLLNEKTCRSRSFFAITNILNHQFVSVFLSNF